MKTMARPVLRYHGGKFLLAPWILSHFPPHRIYTEVYGGAASVLMQKPRCYSEVYNDLSGEVVNLFRVLRDPCQGREIERVLRLTPYARAEFNAAYLAAADPIETARRTVIKAFMGFGSASVSNRHRTGFRANSDRSGTTPAHDWTNYPDALAAMTARLQGVVIENRPALDVIEQHDKADCLHYVDPPYVQDTRYLGAESGVYQHDMTDQQHRDLADLLHQVKGMVILSGYQSPLYLEIYPDWRRVDRKAKADGARERIESLWLNPSASRLMDGRLEL